MKFMHPHRCCVNKTFYSTTETADTFKNTWLLAHWLFAWSLNKGQPLLVLFAMLHLLPTPQEFPPTTSWCLNAAGVEINRVSSSQLKQLKGQQEGREVQHGAVNAITAEQIWRRWAALLFTELSVVLWSIAHNGQPTTPLPASWWDGGETITSPICRGCRALFGHFVTICKFWHCKTTC